MESVFGRSGVADSGGLGELLRQQLGDESEEARRKRMLEQQQGRLLGPAAQSRGGLGLSGLLNGMR
jgi:hypothetical protein